MGQSWTGSFLGPLAHFLTQGENDDRVTMKSMEDGRTEDYFIWQPPSTKMKVSSFAKELGGKPRTFWTKRGPDGVELQDGQLLTITAGIDGKPRHVRLTDEEDNVLCDVWRGRGGCGQAAGKHHGCGGLQP